MILLDFLYYANKKITSIRSNFIQVVPFLYRYFECSDVSEDFLIIIENSIFKYILDYSIIPDTCIFLYSQISKNDTITFSNCIYTRCGATRFPIYIPNPIGENIFNLTLDDIDLYNESIDFINSETNRQTLLNYIDSLTLPNLLKASVINYISVKHSYYTGNYIIEIPSEDTVILSLKHIFLYEQLIILSTTFVEELP